jgi:hypothetical protein
MTERLPYESLTPALVTIIRRGGEPNPTLQALGITDEHGLLTLLGQQVRRALGDDPRPSFNYPQNCSICGETFGVEMMAWNRQDYWSDLGQYLPCIYCAVNDG